MSVSNVKQSVAAVVCLLFVNVWASFAQSQTVMLPTFRNFTVTGSANVPDGGSMIMGGIRRHAEGATSRGLPLASGIPGLNRLFSNRAIGRDTSTAQLVAKPTIIIKEELERDVMAEAYARRQMNGGGVNAAVKKKAAFLSKHVGKGSKSKSESRYGRRR